MFTLHKTCRACGYGLKPAPPGIKNATSERLDSVINLGLHPLANDFCDERDTHAGFAPLEVLRCPACGLGQLSVVVDPRILYRNYPYVTSKSETMHKHFEELCTLIAAEQPLESVLEVGSNDGLFLKACKEHGATSVLGVDPAANLAKLAGDAGIETVCGLFEENIARFTVADIIVARHVFCHIDNWHAFIRACEAVSHRNTLVVLEMPYAGDLVANEEVDTIYHEHLSYVTYKALRALVAPTAFHIHSIRRVSIHGGSLVVMLRHNLSPTDPMGGLQEFIDEESLSLDDWKQLEKKWWAKVEALKAMVKSLRAEGKTVAGFGASAKSTVWVNCCKFTRKDIGFICDNTPQKQWKCSPGTDIPITDEGALLRDKPDYTILFAWNFKNEILEKESLYRSKGGKFIIPTPTLGIA